MQETYDPLSVVEMMLQAKAWNMALKAREKYGLKPAQLSVEKVLRCAAKAGDFIACIRIVDKHGMKPKRRDSKDASALCDGDAPLPHESVLKEIVGEMIAQKAWYKAAMSAKEWRLQHHFSMAEIIRSAKDHGQLHTVLRLVRYEAHDLAVEEVDEIMLQVAAAKKRKLKVFRSRMAQTSQDAMTGEAEVESIEFCLPAKLNFMAMRERMEEKDKMVPDSRYRQRTAYSCEAKDRTGCNRWMPPNQSRCR